MPRRLLMFAAPEPDRDDRREIRGNDEKIDALQAGRIMNDTQIVWVHGYPLSSHVFDRQRSIDARNVMPDLPGFGGTRAGSETTIDDYARFVLDRVDGRAIFAGLSMGGYICFAIARMAPERVAGLILIDTRETADTPEGRKGRYDMIEKVKKDGIKPAVDAMLPKMVASQDKLDEVRRIMESSSADGVMNALRAMAERRDSSDLLPQLKVPALVIVGEKDTITPPSDAERMSRAIPDAKLVTLRGAAHLSNIDQDEQFNRAVASWLSGLPHSPASSR